MLNHPREWDGKLTVSLRDSRVAEISIDILHPVFLSLNGRRRALEGGKEVGLHPATEGCYFNLRGHLCNSNIPIMNIVQSVLMAVGL